MPGSHEKEDSGPSAADKWIKKDTDMQMQNDISRPQYKAVAVALSLSLTHTHTPL